MAQNSKFTEPRETRATAMNRADVYRELYNAVEFNLFGAGSWPADREASAAFWKLLDDLGLTTDDPDKPGTTQYTPLGLELNVELMSIFAGAVNLWDIPLVLDLMGHLKPTFTANFTMRLSSIYSEPVRGLPIEKLRLPSGNCSMIWG
jgi:hypothetical protein